MEIVDKGVIGNSFMDFGTPSEFAKKALYYLHPIRAFLL